MENFRCELPSYDGPHRRGGFRNPFPCKGLQNQIQVVPPKSFAKSNRPTGRALREVARHFDRAPIRARRRCPPARVTDRVFIRREVGRVTVTAHRALTLQHRPDVGRGDNHVVEIGAHRRGAVGLM